MCPSLMKRKSSKDPWRMPCSSLAGDLEARSFGTAIAGGPKASDSPKTSEYAFFKKSKKDAARSMGSYPRHEEDSLMEKSKLNSCMGETANVIRESCKNLQASPHLEKVTPMSVYSFRSRSPLRDLFPSEKSGREHQDENIFSEKRRKLHQWVRDSAGPEIDELCSNGYDLVSVLLSRLFPHSDESKCQCYGGPISWKEDSGSKPKLLASPESDIHSWEAHCTRARNPIQYFDHFSSEICEGGSRGLICSKWDTLDSCSPARNGARKSQSWYNYENLGSNYTHPKTLAGIDRMQYLDNRSPKRKELIHSNWDILDFSSPTCRSARKSHSWYNCGEFGCDLDCKKLAFSTESDSALDFPLRGYGFLASSQVNLYESPPERESNALLLGWDTVNPKHELDMCTTTLNTKLSMHPAPPTLCSNIHLKRPYNKCGSSWLSLSSLLSNDCPNYTSLSHLFSHRYSEYNLERHAHEENECLPAELDQHPLALSCTPSFPGLAKECNVYNTYNSSSILLSQSNHCFITNAFSEKDKSGLEALLSSRFDLNCASKHFPVIDFCRDHFVPCNAFQSQRETKSLGLTEDKFASYSDHLHTKEAIKCFTKDSNNWSSICFQRTWSQEAACVPLLFNDFDRIEYDQVRDCSEDEYV